MAKINLLPWRAKERQQKKVEFFTLMGVFAGIAAAGWGAYWLYIDGEITYQKSRNTYLEQQIGLLDKKIEEIKNLEDEKERLISRMNAIAFLQSSRPIIVRIFDEIVSTLPEGIFINEIAQQGEAITIRGTAQSEGLVSSYMKSLDEGGDGISSFLTNPRLEVIETREEGGRRFSNFTLKVDQAKPPSEDDEELG